MTKKGNREIQLKRTVQELQALYEIGKTLGSELDLQKALKLLLGKALDITRANHGSIGLLDDKGRKLVYKVIIPEDISTWPQKIGEGVTGRTAEKKRAILVSDVRRNDDYIEVFPDMKSELAVPIMDGDKLIGVLNVESPQINGFDRDDQRLLELLASWAVIAIRNATIFEHIDEKLHQRVRELETIRNIDKIIGSTLSPKKVLELIVDKGVRLIKARHKKTKIYGSIQLIEKTTGKLYFTATTAGFALDKKDLRVEIGKEGITGWVAKTQKPLPVNDVYEEPWKKWYIETIPNIKSELAVPLLLGDKLIGIFDLQSPKPDAFDEDDERLIVSLAEQVVVAIRNAEQYQALLSIYNIGKKISSSSDTREVLQLILDKGIEKTGAHYASALVLDRTKSYFDSIVRRGKETDKSRTPIKVGEGIVSAAAKKKKIIRVADVTKDRRYLKFNPTTKSEVVVPMLDAKNELAGVLNFEHPLLGAFDSDDVKFIESLASHAAIVIQRLKKDQELRRTREQLDAANTMFWLTMIKGSWLHEVKQKSHAIRVAVDLLGRNPTIIREGLLGTLERIDNLAEMITTAAPELPSEDVEEAVSIEDILDSVIKKCRRERREIKVNFESSSVELPIITASNAWLTLAFENVIKNSLRAMPSGGALSIGCKKNNNQIDIIIRDTGCGIPKEIQKKLFKQPVSGTKGSGMGLLITKNIMLKYDGNIDLKHTGPQGTIFRLWLPVK